MSSTSLLRLRQEAVLDQTMPDLDVVQVFCHIVCKGGIAWMNLTTPKSSRTELISLVR